jgi:polysaccharide pyruvyl transferase WcaK-like protein
MRTQANDCWTNFARKAALRDGARLPNCAVSPERFGSRLRIALLTPYNGGNLGDAAIQDAIIANLRLQSPEALFSGICLNCENFVERHGTDAFPLCANSSLFYAMSYGSVSDGVQQKEGSAGNQHPLVTHVKRVLKKAPGLLQALKNLRRCVLSIPKEIFHFSGGYSFLRHQDLLIVSGGGQLDEEWGGPWGHPFALFKWALLAWAARVPCAIVSVGVGRLSSPLSRLFVLIALRMANYRSFRDENSRTIAATLYKVADSDLVVPDLAFGLHISKGRQNANIRLRSRGRTIVAISPIAYAKPGNWPSENHAVYCRYLQQMAMVMSRLVDRDYFLVMVWSSLGDDESVIPQIIEKLDDASRKKLAERLYISRIRTWKELVASLEEADFLVASRLHSVILGTVTGTPTVAISFDPKVNWVMQDLGLADYLLPINDFDAEDVLGVLDNLKNSEDSVAARISSYQLGTRSAFDRQYYTLAELAVANQRRKN